MPRVGGDTYTGERSSRVHLMWKSWSMRSTDIAACPLLARSVNYYDTYRTEYREGTLYIASPSTRGTRSRLLRRFSCLFGRAPGLNLKRDWFSPQCSTTFLGVLPERHRGRVTHATTCHRTSESLLSFHVHANGAKRPR